MGKKIYLLLLCIFLSFPILGETIGHSTISRSYYDSATYINFIDYSLVLPVEGKIQSWQIYSQRAGDLWLQVYRYISPNTYMLVGENYVKTSNTGVQTFNIANNQQISFQAGDYIGWRFGATAGTISFGYADPLSMGWSVYPNGNPSVGGAINIYVNDTRTYSILANYSSVPEPQSLVLLGLFICYIKIFLKRKI